MWQVVRAIDELVYLAARCGDEERKAIRALAANARNEWELIRGVLETGKEADAVAETAPMPVLEEKVGRFRSAMAQLENFRNPPKVPVSYVVYLKPCAVCRSDPGFGAIHMGCERCERRKKERDEPPQMELVKPDDGRYFYREVGTGQGESQ